LFFQKNQEKTKLLDERKEEKLKELRRQNTERLKSGQNPFYMKKGAVSGVLCGFSCFKSRFYKGELKRTLHDEYIQELDQSGRLDKYMKRREKKEATKLKKRQI